MKTWEMIKAIMNDNTKKFELVKCDSGDSINGKVEIIRNKLCWSAGYEFPMNIVVNDNDVWEEVIEPVDFLIAYNDCLENGNKYKGIDTENVSGVQTQTMILKINRCCNYRKSKIYERRNLVNLYVD